MSVLVPLITTPTGAREFCEYNGHATLLALMSSDDAGVSSAVDELLEEEGAARVAAQIGLPFPFLGHRRILESNESCAAPLLQYDFGGAQAVSLLVQPVSSAQESQFTVGFMMWPAAVILSRWIRHAPSDLFLSRTVHELGAGLGLSGLAAADLASSVVLSDFNPVVVENLRENIGLNDASSTCSTCILDWNDPASIRDKQVDLVIASDVVCQASDAVLLAATIKAAMLPSGAAIIVLPCPDSRFGTEAFPVSLTEVGLEWTSTRVRRPDLLANVEEAAYITYDAYLIWGDKRDVSSWHSNLQEAFVAIGSTE